MIVYPAIDIRGGRCVRLVEGDFNRETVFDADPVDAARRWVEAGAAWLHVVDLDGAREGRPANLETIRRLRSSIDIPIQYGGGLRQMSDLEAVFAIGMDRAVLGTAAINDDALVAQATDRWGDRIAAGLDARDDLLAAGAWLEQTAVSAQSRALELCGAGIQHVIYTDIRRDGTLRGPNLDALSELNRRLSSAGRSSGVIASGGVGSLDDVSTVARVGVAAVIIGRALYDGRIDLPSAIATARDQIEIAS
jgi:phosphoribosylformimino-5-aminoimidazole carboxamide ribotide isomerase